MKAVVKYQELFDRVREGYLYNHTAPKYRNGRGYFYLISRDGKDTKSYVYTMTPSEFRNMKFLLEQEMQRLSGKKYYTKKKRRRRVAQDSEYVEISEPGRYVLTRALKTYTNALNISIADTASMNAVTLKLAWPMVLTLLKFTKLTPYELIEIKDDPDKFGELLFRKFIEMIESAVDPEQIRRLEEQVEQLSVENENYKAENELLKAVNGELYIQLSALSGLVDPVDLQRFVAWNNMRYAMGWSPLHNVSNYPDLGMAQVSIVSMPSLKEHYRQEKFQDYLLLLYALKQLKNSEQLIHDYFSTFRQLIESDMELMKKEMLGEIHGMHKRMDELSFTVQQLSTPQQIVVVPQPAPPVQPKPEFDVKEAIEKLKKMGYTVQPPLTRDDLKNMKDEIMSEMKSSESSSSSALEILQYAREERLIDKIIGTVLLLNDKISKDDFFQIAEYNIQSSPLQRVSAS